MNFAGSGVEVVHSQKSRLSYALSRSKNQSCSLRFLHCGYIVKFWEMVVNYGPYTLLRMADESYFKIWFSRNFATITLCLAYDWSRASNSLEFTKILWVKEVEKYSMNCSRFHKLLRN